MLSLFYGVQFRRNPLDHASVEHVVRLLQTGRLAGLDSHSAVVQIDAALATDYDFGELPLSHDNNLIRSFLAKLRATLISSL